MQSKNLPPPQSCGCPKGPPPCSPFLFVLHFVGGGAGVPLETFAHPTASLKGSIARASAGAIHYTKGRLVLQNAEYSKVLTL